jgi:hypothetical protein
MTLLRELIDIPETVHKGDFVMSLAKGVRESEETLKHYVVTDQLARAYANALGFIASALKEGASKAAYLDGSFGSGKSHFMAVLHLLLQRDPGARGIPELAGAIGKHDDALAGQSFELVPLHMIGAESMEERVFGGYIAHLRHTDPDASLPGVYADEPLFEQAELLRRDLGDEQFFERLNGVDGGGGAEEGWGELAAAWTPETYDQARSAIAGNPDRGRLGGAIVAGLMPGFREAMRGASTGYVDMDTGLAELARHASARGHDALVLFLDELILWLGSRIHDPAFVAREGQKLIKLIEFTTPRPIPIVSFVARQRDLREFVGDQIPGAEKLSFADTLKHWNDRFHSVTLHDRDLPKIAERRLLEPRSEAARQEIDAAFRETERARPEVLNVLMTEDGDRELFRSTYPFSPAFMNTLVAASSALQRERTALRVMLQLLVDRRNELEVGDLVSVGALFDVLAQGDEPFTEEMKRQFDHAKELYRDQFRPLLLAENGVSESDVAAKNGDHPIRRRTAREDAPAGRARASDRRAAQPRCRQAHCAQPRLDRLTDPRRGEKDRAPEAAPVGGSGRRAEARGRSAKPVGGAAPDRDRRGRDRLPRGGRGQRGRAPPARKAACARRAGRGGRQCALHRAPDDLAWHATDGRGGVRQRARHPGPSRRRPARQRRPLEDRGRLSLRPRPHSARRSRPRRALARRPRPESHRVLDPGILLAGAPGRPPGSWW